MDLAIGLPNAVPGTTREELNDFAKAAEDAGFSSLGTIDRVVYPNIEPITALISNLVADLTSRPDQVVESREIIEVLQRAIDTLPPKQQTAVILYYLHGYSLAQAAEIAGCNVGTMKSRVHYALKALRSRLPKERRTAAGARVSRSEL